MKQNIVEVMAGRIQSVDLTIQGVGQPGQRVPILCVACVERPEKDLPTQSRMDDLIVRDIILIVEIDERVAHRWAIKSRSDNDQEQAGDDDETFASSIHGMVGCGLWHERRIRIPAHTARVATGVAVARLRWTALVLDLRNFRSKRRSNVV